MKFTELFIGELKEHIKLYIKANPFISIADIRQKLSKGFNHDFDWRTVQKYVEEIRKERIDRIKKTTPEKYIANFAEMIETHNDIRHAIYTSVSIEPKDRLKAMKDAEKSVEAIVDLAMDLGLHKRDLGSLSVDDGVTDEDENKLTKFLAGFGIMKADNKQNINGANSNKEKAEQVKAKRIVGKTKIVKKSATARVVQKKDLGTGKARK